MTISIIANGCLPACNNKEESKEKQSRIEKDDIQTVPHMPRISVWPYYPAINLQASRPNWHKLISHPGGRVGVIIAGVDLHHVFARPTFVRPLWPLTY